MKRIFFTLISFSYLATYAQPKVTKYYTADWVETSKDKAAYYADFIQDGNKYDCTSYWINTQSVRSRSAYSDSGMQNQTGLQLLYFKNGHTEDSSLLYNNKLIYSYHYYPDDHLAMHYFIPEHKRQPVVEGYTESGEKIRNYIFQREAEFKGGPENWDSYISQNATKVFFSKGKDTETVTVKVEFIVDKNGDIVSPKILESSGYKNVDNEALRVISKSPSWKSAVLYNEPVNAYRVQPFVYTLLPQTK